MKRITCLAILFAMTMGISAQTQTQVKMQIWKNGKPTNYVVSSEIDSITFLEETIIPKTVKGTKIWPIILDGISAEANTSKIVADFRPDDVGKFMYVWENTYTANANPSGLNFYGNTDGYTALTVSGGWSGCGFCLTNTDVSKAWEAAEALRADIVANSNDYYLHLAIKSTDNASHCFYVFGSEATKFVLGSTPVYSGPIYENFTRDGEWAEFDIPMSRFSTALATTTCVAGVNVLVTLSEGIVGAQLNLDAVYFYKK